MKALGAAEGNARVEPASRVRIGACAAAGSWGCWLLKFLAVSVVWSVGVRFGRMRKLDWPKRQKASFVVSVEGDQERGSFALVLVPVSLRPGHVPALDVVMHAVPPGMGVLGGLRHDRRRVLRRSGSGNCERRN